MNELPVIDPSVCTKISAIATMQPLCRDPKNHFGDKASLFPAASSKIDSGDVDSREVLVYLLNNHDM